MEKSIKKRKRLRRKALEQDHVQKDSVILQRFCSIIFAEDPVDEEHQRKVGEGRVAVHMDGAGTEKNGEAPPLK